MVYYRVKPEFDNVKADRRYNIFVSNELLTEKEVTEALKKFVNRNDHVYGRGHIDKPENFWKMFDRVEISCRNTYWFFGARFAKKESVGA